MDDCRWDDTQEHHTIHVLVCVDTISAHPPFFASSTSSDPYSPAHGLPAFGTEDGEIVDVEQKMEWALEAPSWDEEQATPSGPSLTDIVCTHNMLREEQMITVGKEWGAIAACERDNIDCRYWLPRSSGKQDMITSYRAKSHATIASSVTHPRHSSINGALGNGNGNNDVMHHTNANENKIHFISELVVRVVVCSPNNNFYISHANPNKQDDDSHPNPTIGKINGFKLGALEYGEPRFKIMSGETIVILHNLSASTLLDVNVSDSIHDDIYMTYTASFEGLIDKRCNVIIGAIKLTFTPKHGEPLDSMNNVSTTSCHNEHPSYLTTYINNNGDNYIDNGVCVSTYKNNCFSSCVGLDDAAEYVIGLELEHQELCLGLIGHIGLILMLDDTTSTIGYYCDCFSCAIFALDNNQTEVGKEVFFPFVMERGKKAVKKE